MSIGVGAQSTFGGQDIFAWKYAWKINKIPEFYMIFSRKINKMPEFYTIFARKIVFAGIWGKKIPPPVSYAYAYVW